MVQFAKLRLSGFKSFVDRTELDIGSGLNGIVGPNGCGKSNLVEALRWVMGENSAKRMRGDGMEDVIFAGTDKRSARNIAEVSLLLENRDKDAPHPYNAFDEIEMTRKIERDYGSTYKINGKTVRARDVHMFFADTVSGASSPALVSQGRVTQIINAKPHERRQILEESAGISGLFARRHEAELRLRAADKNLQRIDDVFGSMEGRLNSLKRQARQAAKFRNLNAQIRQLELVIAYLEWQTLQNRYKQEELQFAEAESAVAEHLVTVTQLTKTQNTQIQDLPPLRDAEAKASAALQTQKITLQRIEDDLARAQAARDETQQQLEQVRTDMQHEQSTFSEGESLIEKLQEEAAELHNIDENGDQILLEKLKLRDEAKEHADLIEAEYTAITASDAEARAKKEALERSIQQLESRLSQFTVRKEASEKELQELEQNVSSSDKDLSSEISELESLIEQGNEDEASSKEAIETLELSLQAARDAMTSAQRELSDVQAELSVLQNMVEDSDDGSTVLSLVNAEQGFEAALSRALGDSLQASLDKNAPHYWRGNVNCDQALPSGAQGLLPKIKAPEQLKAALSQIGVVDTVEQGEQLLSQLKPGQSLVSKDGAYWRWDGLCMKPDAKDQNALRLEQKNKLAALQKKEPSLQAAQDKAQQELDTLKTKLAETKQVQQENYSALQQSRRELDNLRRLQSERQAQTERRKNKIESLRDTIEMTKADMADVAQSLQSDQDALKALQQGENSESQARMEEVRAQLTNAREDYQEKLRDSDRFEQDNRSRKARMQAIADERNAVQNRTIRARERLKELTAREEELSGKLKALNDNPEIRDKEKQALLTKISELEGIKSSAAEKLSSFEVDLAETNKALKKAEEVLTQSREQRAGAQARLGGLKEQQDVLQAQIFEQFELGPNELKSGITSPDHELEPAKLGQYKSRKEQLIREKEAIGAVNLRADEEALELEKEVSSILSERNDLTQAIDELRGGIQKINKEARERLLVAFDHVNAHFSRLFQTLFNGGKAHLALIDSDDPLEGGLEIFAQPPGKSLQSLSLMSGGEQTLASIALIFGMFLTNPSPICVLDEIDAPLDDANVDRLCDLLDDISMRGKTRFLIVTHHRLTMARMDRLYGVTMAERGVSQLVSVDLQQSFEFLDDKQAA